MGRDLAWLCLCIAPYSQSPLTPPDVFLSSSRTPPLLCPRSRSFPSFILVRFGTCAFVAPTIALPISVITACETCVRLPLLLLLLLLLLLFLFLSVLSSPIVLACPSHLLLFLGALSFVLVPLGRHKVHS